MNKIDGEFFDIDKKKEEGIIKSDDEINAKYKKGEIRIVTEQARYPVKSIKSMIDEDDYMLGL